jgi:hypothetical protein
MGSLRSLRHRNRDFETQEIEVHDGFTIESNISHPPPPDPGAIKVYMRGGRLYKIDSNGVESLAPEFNYLFQSRGIVVRGNYG